MRHHRIVIGQRFGKWKILSRVQESTGAVIDAVWHCQCACGRAGQVRQWNLVSGRSTGCFDCRFVGKVKRKRLVKRA